MNTDGRTEAVTQNTSPPKRDRGGLLAWIGLGVIALLFLTYLKWRPLPIADQGIDHPAVGQPVVFHELQPLTGGEEEFTRADLRGKVTLVNLWATWCGPCHEEFPYLNAIYKQFKIRNDFRYLSISYPGGPQSIDELREATKEFMSRQRADHATYYDPGGQTALALLAVDVSNSLPTTLVIDRQGIIRGVWEGYSRGSISEIERLLGELLE